MKSDDVYAGGEGLVWHPAIRALGWVKDWIVWAAFAGVLWEALAVGLGPTSPGSVVARTVLICAALLCAVVPLFLLHNWLSIVQRVRKEYPVRWFSTGVILVVTAVMLTIAALYGWLVQWTFVRLWPPGWRLGQDIPPYEWSRASMPIWVGVPVLAGAIAFAFVLLRPLGPKHARVWRLLGSRRALAGYGIMALLRFRQPRKDFFAQAPLFREVPWFAVASVIYDVQPLGIVSQPLAFLVATISLAHGLDLLLPPAWLFLGRSHFDSFRTFDRLRFHWPVFGVTLLDRDSKEWHAYYFAAAEAMARRGSLAARFMNKPGTPRVWSLRSRGELWESTVALLMRLAVVVVVDARVKSYYVFDEVLWLAELHWIDKAWLLGEPDRTAPALDGALAWAEEDNVALPPGTDARLAARVVTEEQLYSASWTASGLRIAGAD
jgi:hypothetical protein